MASRRQTKLPMKALVQWQDGLVSRIPTSKFTSQRSELVVGNSVRAWSKQNDVHDCRILYLHGKEIILTHSVLDPLPR